MLAKSTGLFSVVVFFAILLIILSTTPTPEAVTRQSKSGTTYKDYVPKPKLPKPKLPSLDSFRFTFYPPAVHAPEVQKNSTDGKSKWYSDWKWLNPFSSSVTLEEDRSVLPPLRERPPIYTFYDSLEKKDKDVAEADRKLLRAWRRAWYAQGFRPVVLGPLEAQNNRLYEAFQRQGIKKELEDEITAWMAWGTMQTGVLADWQAFPMGPYDDPLLVYLRRGGLPTHITRLKDLNSALFSGVQDKVNEAIRLALNNRRLKEAKSIIELIPKDMFNVETSSSIAYYDPVSLSSLYPTIAENMEKSRASGRLALVDLINSHLHNTFQNIFRGGIAVLKPFPEHTTALVAPGSRLAALLAECTTSSVPKSCPPNIPRCKPCTAGPSMKITYPDSYKNQSRTFTIGTVPHPYTFVSLQKGDDNVTVPYIRRETGRDRWLVETTKHVLGKERGAPSRIVAFKDIVAGDFGVSRSLWFTVENLPAKSEEQSLPPSMLDDLDWYFGFIIPRKTKEELSAKENPSKKEKQPNEKLENEFTLINKARKLVNSRDKKGSSIRDVAEAWNLADTEIWRFVRAYRARNVVQRKKWEEEEKKFAGS
ncbi:hypothetical protein VTO42DRAFT_1976 [Malbranchea cinnamomea]